MNNNFLDRLVDPNWWVKNSTEDLYFLCRSMLMTLESPKHGYQDLYAPTHKRICSFIEKYAMEGQKCILLTPRHWIKSYLVSVGWMIQRILRNKLAGRKEINLITNATYPNAVGFLSKIKYNFEHNDFLRGIYYGLLPKDPKSAGTWKEEEINIAGTTISVGAVEKNLVSQHFYVIIHDDLVNYENSQTKNQIEKIYDWWALANSLLHPKGVQIIIGTRWNYDDLYGMLIDKFLQPAKGYEEYLDGNPIVELHKGNWHLLQMSCWSDPIRRIGSTFPILFPEERLHELESELADRFPGQMENNPGRLSTNPIKREWITRYHKINLPPIRYTLMLVDPSGRAKSEESSYSGIVVTHLCADKKVYFEFGKRFLITDMALAEKMIEVALIYRPDTMGVEELKFDTMHDLLELVIEKMIRHKEVAEEDMEYIKSIPNIMIELKPKGRPKEVRIKQTGGFVQSGQFLFPFNGTEELEDELIRGGTKNDIADAMAYTLDNMIFPRIDDPPKLFTIPEKLKMTDEERMKEEWENISEEIYVGQTPKQGFPEFELY